MMTAIPENSRTEYYKLQKELSDLEGKMTKKEGSNELPEGDNSGISSLKKSIDTAYSKLSFKDKLLVNSENHKKKLLQVGLRLRVLSVMVSII
jgi:hypothetical protein